MDYLPIFLDVAGKKIVVDGGTTVAARRIERALSAGAKVHSFDPEPGEEVRAFFGHERLTHHDRLPKETDFEDCHVAYGASEVAQRDDALYRWAKAHGALANVADEKEYCDFITPSVVERDPLTIAISTGGAAPVVARILRARVEAMLPAAYGRLADFLSGYRDRIAEKIKGGTARRRFWENMIEGPVGDAFLAGDEALADELIRNDLAQGGAEKLHRGEVWLVGAGPGDPDLLTFKALRMMQHADVVLYDRLIGPGMLDLVRRDAERINVGKQAGNHVMTQEETTALIIKLASEGKRVLRLKGGDPFIFGRGGEELEDVAAHGIPVIVVPGITAAAGCGASAGIPLTHRAHAQAVTFVTAHGKDGLLPHDWKRLARHDQTVVVYMGLRFVGEIAAAAMAQGVEPSMPIAVIDNGTRTTQRVVVGTLEDIGEKVAKARLKGPALIVIGSVVTMRDTLGIDVTAREEAHTMELVARDGL
ncbi:siroheme synthase CysG [Sinisalibacter lacisalsi]|uniref:Siroheme synthase n=1 Tax=Sinisalibacter lacisalsi TaxID=1526570 RepID=A0ABQ1QBT0_9RHOB|nr:siroheme synthase CysG [Sinisalibacter lacisalsi]GGD22376.1 siroheme synthase [Sinisalibacter lacisalsi]